MKTIILHGIICVVAISFTACAPQATAAPTVDVAATMAIEIASMMQTQTAGAATQTPLPPTETATPIYTETSSVSPTETSEPKPPAVVVFASCFTGPGENFTLISNIDPSIRQSGRQRVELLGMGSEPGWIIIRNPYFNNPCWIKLEYLEIDPGYDLTQLPVMTPGAP